MLWRNRIGSFQSQHAGRAKPKPGIVPGVTKHEHQIHARVCQSPQSFPDQRTSDTGTLAAAGNGERGKNSHRDFLPLGSESCQREEDVADQPAFRVRNQ